MTRLNLASVAGSGAHAEVYLIHNLKQRTFVARKVLTKCDHAKFEKEVTIQTIAAMNHCAPKILAINKRRCTIDMEIGGESLDALCIKQGKTLDEAQQRSLVKLIECLVKAKVRHNDLHPGNILRFGTNRFIAIDFGEAKANHDFEKGSSAKQFMGNQLAGILYHKDVGLIATKKLKSADILDAQLERWGVPPPSASSRKRRLHNRVA